MVRNLAHLMIEDPLGKLAGEFLLGHQVEGFFHIGDFFRRHRDSMLAEHHDRHVARVTVKNGEAEGMMELGVPLRIVSKLTQVTRTVGHSAFSLQASLRAISRCYIIAGGILRGSLENGKA